MNIGRYEVVQELGQGGMAMVYLARDPYMKRQVAVKVLPRQFTFDPQFRTRFQREAEVIATLEHDSIVPVHDFGEHEDQPFIVMRYMSGGTLADRLSQGPLPIPEIAILFERIGSALDHAHSLGVIHRDIKPGNILFDSRGGSYLSDFGIAKIAESTAAFTGTGIIGTPAYMSPEQALGEKNLDGRCDIYSLGVVLFQALTGELPYKADTPMGVAVAHINEPVPSLLGRRPDLPPAFETVIRKALDKDPAKRYQTAGELAGAIRQAMNETGTLLEDRTYLEPVAGTVIEPMAGTYVEARSDPPSAPSQPPPAHGAGAHPSTVPPASAPRQTMLPRWLGVGGVAILGLCICIGVIGAFATNLIPNPFASPPTETISPTSAIPAPSETPDLPETPVVTQFVPVGLTSTYIEYILDASGSMLQTLQGKTRLQIAQDVLTARLGALPPNTQVGLRVYGHRVPYQGREAESCEDIELVVPIQANGAQAIIDWLPSMQALGMTPMSASIQQAANDFTFEPGRRNFIVLISDGEETCGEEPATVVEYLKEIGIDFAIHVIGLDVDGQTAAQLRRISDAAGGVYYDAKSEEDLNNALANVNETILVPDQAPTQVAEASATPFPEPNAEVASEGTVEASSIYDSNYPASLGVDGDLSTSWFSAGAIKGDATPTYIWTGLQDDFIGSIELISNGEHQVVDFRTGYGFEEVTIQVLDAQGNVLFEESANLAGTPDPDVRVTPNVVGRSVRMIFTGGEAPDCGGFGELKIGAVRPSPIAEVTFEGTVEASSIYDSTYPASLAIDGDLSTSWFSAGAIKGDSNPAFVWTGVQDDFIASIELISNREHRVVDFRTGYGFEEVTIQVLDAQGNVVFEESARLEGTPDPDIHVTPNVVGRSVRMIFSGGEAPDCGGFGELKIWAVRSKTAQSLSTPPGELVSASFTAETDMLCREGPSTSHVDRWQLNKGETVPVLAQWHEDPHWLLVDINSTETRTDCCWVGGEGTLNVSSDQIKSINFLPDRLDCSAVM